MTVSSEDRSATLRATLDPLSWPDRFDFLREAEKAARSSDERAAIVQMTTKLADAALVALSPEWEGRPFKDAILRLPSKRLRGALTRAAKRARDRYVVDAIANGLAPLDEQSSRRRRFAVGLDERAIEMPLALATARLSASGEVLDAGSALNLPVVRQIVGRPVARVTHFTLPGTTEPVLPGDADRFVLAFGDLRALTFPDGAFDRVVCVSTLEHVGMDTTRYSDQGGHASGSGATALAELMRVLAPGGELVLTVPYGRSLDGGWFRVFDRAGLTELLAPTSSQRVESRFFYYDSGWLEGDDVPPAVTVDTPFFDDVITGVAVVRVLKSGGTA